MIIVRCQQHCLLIKKRGDDRVYDRVGFPRSGRPLYIGHRIFYGIVDGQKLIQIHFFLKESQRILPAPDRSRRHLPEKCLDRPCLFALFQTLCDPLIFVIQVYLNIPCKRNDIRAVIHSLAEAVISCDPVLYQLPVLIKIIQQIIIRRVHILSDALLFSAHGKLPAHCHFVVRPQCSPADIQIQSPVSHHIQRLFSRLSAPHRNAQFVKGKLPVLPFMISCMRGTSVLRTACLVFSLTAAFTLKLLHKFRKLPVIQKKFPAAETAAVKLFYQCIITFIQLRIQTAAVRQIVQYFQVHRLSEQRLIFFRMFLNIPHKLRTYLTIRGFHHGSRQDRVQIDHPEFTDRMFYKVKALHTQCSVFHIDPVDSDPVICRFLILVSILDADPFSFVDCPENTLCNMVHRLFLCIS